MYRIFDATILYRRQIKVLHCAQERAISLARLGFWFWLGLLIFVSLAFGLLLPDQGIEGYLRRLGFLRCLVFIVLDSVVDLEYLR